LKSAISNPLWARALPRPLTSTTFRLASLWLSQNWRPIILIPAHIGFQAWNVQANRPIRVWRKMTIRLRKLGLDKQTINV